MDMRKDIRTLPRLRPFAWICAASALAIISLPLAAQDGRSSSHHAEAELHITAIVVPVVLPPHDDRDDDKNGDRRQGRHDDAISYNLSPGQNNLSITEEMRAMPIERGQTTVQVKLTTIVAK